MKNEWPDQSVQPGVQGADAHAARVVLAALATAHGQAALLSADKQNAEFLQWYKEEKGKQGGLSYYEFAIRRFLERLGKTK